METTKLTDAELLEQLVGAVSRRECSPNYAIQAAFKLGVAQGKLEQALIAVETVNAIKVDAE